MATEGKKFRCQWKGCYKIVIIAVKGSQVRKDTQCYCGDCNKKMVGIIRILEQTKQKSSPMSDLFGADSPFGDIFK